MSREVGVHHPHKCPSRPVQYDHVQWDWDSNDHVHGDYHRSADHRSADHESADHGHPKRGESVLNWCGSERRGEDRIRPPIPRHLLGSAHPDQLHFNI